MLVLGIESSCDDLGAAVFDATAGRIRSCVARSQVNLHSPFGGVVPEVASRDHVRHVGRVIERALVDADVTCTELDGIAVTSGPGLIGSLLCGVEAAKGLAFAARKPIVAIHHLEGHIAAAFLETVPPDEPFVALLVSGGHTSLVLVDALGGPYRELSRTRDDAAGEALDKVAKILGLGYPGGAAMDRLASGGDRKRFSFPKAMPGKDNLEFSFSGLKTAASRAVAELGGPPTGEPLSDFCASFQEAIVENLAKKACRAAVLCDARRIVVAGGVAANSRLRSRLLERGRRERIFVHLPAIAHCTDNAAMIARAGATRLLRGENHGLSFLCRPEWALDALDETHAQSADASTGRL